MGPIDTSYSPGELAYLKLNEKKGLGESKGKYMIERVTVNYYFFTKMDDKVHSRL